MSDNSDRQFDLPGADPLKKEWRSTRDGRIVYDRKKHVFTTKDLIRIATSTKNHWDEEPNQWVVKDRIYLLLEYCRYYLQKYYEKQPQTSSVLSSLTVTIQEATKALITEILQTLGVPLPVGAVLSEKLYGMLYNAVAEVIDFATGGKIIG